MHKAVPAANFEQDYKSRIPPRVMQNAACRLAKFFITVSEFSHPSRVPEANPSSTALARHSRYDRCSANAVRVMESGDRRDCTEAMVRRFASGLGILTITAMSATL